MSEDGPRRGEPDGARDTPPPGAPSPYPAEECAGPTPYDPTILVFRDVPWITKPGVYPGLTNTEYQRDPVVDGSVTSSFLRKMTPPEGTPAHAWHYLTAPREEKGYYDVGSGYHTMTLGRGDAVVEIEADDWKSPKARALRDAAYRARAIPLLSKHVRVVEAMHATTMAHPRCAEFFTPGRFTAELVIVWEDPETGVMCRAMIDAVPDYLSRMVMVDLKGLSVDTSIPTPTGWATMRAVQVGDEVFGADGRPCRVTAKSEVHWRRCYRIRFDDGSSVVCDDEHRWLTTAGRPSSRYRWQRTAVRTTDEIRNSLRDPVTGQRHHRVALPGALQTPDVDLPIHPYVLGCWLGDGSASGALITSADPEVFERIGACGYAVGPNLIHPHHQHSDTRAAYRSVYGLHAQLRKAGLLGHKSVPEIYLRASERQRLDLLRGLMDTDGTWNTLRKQAVFSNTDKALSEAVRELACSLGQRAVIGRVTQRGFGVTVESYPVSWRPVGGVVPFALERKARGARDVSAGDSSRRLIVSVDEVPTVPTQCIEVDSPDHTYLCTESMIPTHNTKAGNADPVSVSTSLAKYRYHQQFAFYLAGLRELVRLGLIDPVEAIDPWIVVCGTEPPHVPLCRPIAEDAINVGMVENRKALDLYATCRATGEWPGYDDPDGPLQVIDLPKWKYYQFNAALTDGVYDTEELW